MARINVSTFSFSLKRKKDAYLKKNATAESRRTIGCRMIRRVCPSRSAVGGDYDARQTPSKNAFLT